jgi:NAD(P)-dependent dehydrogenase (short-subunit alcohol dehydrogenase family)
MSRGGRRGFVVKADVADPAALTGAVRLWPRISGGSTSLSTMPAPCLRGCRYGRLLEHYQQVLDVNLTSVFAARRAAILIMRSRGGGNIINVTLCRPRAARPAPASAAVTRRSAR